jgi:hypothetical protein
MSRFHRVRLQLLLAPALALAACYPGDPNCAYVFTDDCIETLLPPVIVEGERECPGVWFEGQCVGEVVIEGGGDPGGDTGGGGTGGGGDGPGETATEPQPPAEPRKDSFKCFDSLLLDTVLNITVGLGPHTEPHLITWNEYRSEVLSALSAVQTATLDEALAATDGTSMRTSMQFLTDYVRTGGLVEPYAGLLPPVTSRDFDRCRADPSCAAALRDTHSENLRSACEEMADQNAAFGDIGPIDIGSGF